VVWRCWLGGRKDIRHVKKTEWWGAGVVICLERGADLHMAQLMPLPLTVSCFSKIHTWYWLTRVVPDKGPLNRCVYVCMLLTYLPTLLTLLFITIAKMWIDHRRLCLCTQLIISVCLYQSETREAPFQVPSLRFTLPFAVPGILYCMTNNLGIHVQLQMDPASYQASTSYDFNK